MDGDDRSTTIVVGVDGSESGWRALRWAVRESAGHGLRCLLLIVVEYGMLGLDPRVDTSVSALRAAADAVLDEAEAMARDAGVEVERRVVEGMTAAQALVDASADAAMLVVGHRGRGGMAGMLLGSVSNACVHHAQCPVVVMRGSDDDPHASAGRG